MNRPTRKEFLALFVVCVIVKPIARYLVFLSSLFFFLKGFFSQLVATGELCHPSLRGSEGLLNDITTLLVSFGNKQQMKARRETCIQFWLFV